MSEHLVHLNQDIQPPQYLEEQPLRDLSLLYPKSNHSYLNVDLIQDWPQAEPPVLDASQFEALRRILTKRLAIIQGPPGTGKTHVSVAALELLLQNMAPGDPPIILAAHTNHAVDQLLRHVARFEPEFIRLGGRTTDYEHIKPRTLFEVRAAARAANPSSAPKLPSLAKMKGITKDMKDLLAPLANHEEPIASEVFLRYKVITKVQYESLKKGASEWVRTNDRVTGDIAMWLGRDLVPADARTQPEQFGFEYEEVDLEFEQLKELEAEAKLDDEAIETLRGEWLSLLEPFTGQKTRGVGEEVAKAALEKDDLWDIKEFQRGPVYRVMQQKLKDEMRKKFRQLAKIYQDCVLEARIGRWEADAKYLRDARVIGMTTTGLSKYRGMIQNLQPRIVLIEEAAETLEAYVAAACFQSLHHLILVGDHQQLRGHCSVRELEGHPWFLDVSMFERLVKNHVGFSKMITQRRMVPEIRRALKPIYEELEDYESVLNRPPIVGMGDVSTYFFSHEWPETTDDHMSKVNHDEAAMIIGFFDYLVHNGMNSQKITVLTFYNGQRKLLLKGLRTHPNLQGCIFKVVTVDSYQGEENDIVILSLVRNNYPRNIGFLKSENRVCVALSRAQRGFYIFGNAEMLSRADALWWAVIQAMGKDPCRVGFKLPLTCTNHRNTVHVEDGLKFIVLTGGCELSCEEKLPCGHDCALKCHPFTHDLINCKKPCERKLECGHHCEEVCYLPCRCECHTGRGRSTTRGTSPVKVLRSSQAPLQRRPRDAAEFPESRAFRDYAEGGHVESDAKLAAQAADEFSRLHLHGEKGQDVKLVRTSSNARGVWKGVYGNIGPERSSTDQRKENGESSKVKGHAWVESKEETSNAKGHTGVRPKGESLNAKDDVVVDSTADNSVEASTAEEIVGGFKGKGKAPATEGFKGTPTAAGKREKKRKATKKLHLSLLD